MKNRLIEDLGVTIEQMITNPNNGTDSFTDIIEELLYDDSLTQNQYKEINLILSKVDDDTLKSYHYKGYFLYKSKNNEKAIYYFKKYVDLVLSNKNYTASGMYDEVSKLSIRHCNFKLFEQIWQYFSDKALNINSENELSFILRYINEADIDKSIDYLFNAINKNENSWISYYHLGQVYYGQKNYYTAIKNYLNCVDIFSTLKIANYILVESYFNLGFLYDVLKNYPASEKAYRSCIELLPIYDYANNNLGYCLYKQEKYKESLKIFNYCIENSLDGEYPIFNKIRALTKLGEYDKALNFITKYEKSVKGKKAMNFLKNDVIKCIDKQNKKNRGVIEVPKPELSPVAPNTAININVNNQIPETKIDPYSKERELEFLLEQRIRNGHEVHGRKLRMYDDYGRQYSTPIGRIDLLTIDEVTDEILIIELKKGKSDDEVCGQILRYINYVKEHIAKENQRVIGLIYILSASEKLKYAIKNNNDIILYEYKDMRF